MNGTDATPPSGLANYRRHTHRLRLMLTGLLLAVALLFCASLCAGSASLDWEALYRAVFDSEQCPDSIIFWDLRLPRTLAAILAGTSLGMAGCVMQNVLKNPMASPSTLGVSQAAVFGVNLAIIVFQAGSFHRTDGTQLTFTNPYLVTLSAFALSLLCLMLLLLLARRRGFAPETIVLSGIAIGAACSAGSTILQFFALDTQIAAAVFWTFGDLGRVSQEQNLALFAVALLAGVYFFLHRWDYNAMATSEDYARSLGVKTADIRFWSLLLASLICAVTVSFLGIIGFVGLVSPQLARRFLGNDHRYLLPGAALTGAILLLLADIIARISIRGTALPVGAVTSFFGAPIFLWILLQPKRRHRP